MQNDTPPNSGILCVKGDLHDWNQLCDKLYSEGRKHTRTVSIQCKSCGLQVNHRVYDDNTLLYFCCGEIQVRPIIINQTT